MKIGLKEVARIKRNKTRYYVSGLLPTMEYASPSESKRTHVQIESKNQRRLTEFVDRFWKTAQRTTPHQKCSVVDQLYRFGTPIIRVAYRFSRGF